MAKIEINIPANMVTRVTDAICANGDFSEESGMTKAEFCKYRLIQWIKSEVFRHEQRDFKTTLQVQEKTFETNTLNDLNVIS